MRAFQLIAGLGLIFVSFLSLSCTSAEPAAVSSTANAPKAAGGDDENVTGPYTHQNLAVFLIHGTDRTAGHKYITLQEALEQKKAIVHETGNVNELAVENVSDDDVYIQCGEIVKGGQQDRTLGTDIILTKAMGKMPIASLCAEP